MDKCIDRGWDLSCPQEKFPYCLESAFFSAKEYWNEYKSLHQANRKVLGFRHIGQDGGMKK